MELHLLEEDDADTVADIEQSLSNKKSRGRQTTKKDKSDNPPVRVHCTVTNCSYSTPYKKDLVRHMRKHTGEKPYSCELCSKQFSRYDKLLQHTRVHEGLRPCKCTFSTCTYSCIDITALKKHIARIHSDNKPYQCHLCSYSTKDSHQLNIHTRFHTGDSPYTCVADGCTSAFKTPTDLRRHNRIHFQEKPYCCNNCSYATAVKCNLTVHIKRKHPVIDSEGTSPSISKITGTSKKLGLKTKPTQVIPKRNLPFQIACSFCTYKTGAIKSFKLHMLRKHKTSNYDSVLNEFERPKKQKHTPGSPNSQFVRTFVCSDYSCMASFVSEKSLNCHMKQHITLHPPPAPTVEVVISSDASITETETNNHYYIESQNQNEQDILGATDESPIISTTSNQQSISVITYAEPSTSTDYF